MGIAAISLVVLSTGAGFVLAHVKDQKIVPRFAGPLIPYDRNYTTSLLWGTYRPGMYFGVQSRTSQSLEMGLMWFTYSGLGGGKLDIRHLCDQNDRLRYGWLDHDGRSFGYQEILDGYANISTSEQTSSWVARVSLQQNTQYRWSPKAANFRSKMSIIVYFKLEDAGKISPIVASDKLISLEGSTPSLGNFSIHFKRHSETDVGTVFGDETSSFVATTLTKWTELEKTILNNTGIKLGGIVSHSPNLIAVELAVFPNFTLDIVYETLRKEDDQSNSLASISAASLTEVILRKRRHFKEKLRKAFRVDEEHEDFAQAVSILGEEARSRVPDQFVVQNPDYANPPSFLLTAEAMLDRLDLDCPDETDKTLKFFTLAFPRLQAWHN
ncbi:hypothetical protein RvY_08360 [Ramazzottius varieornatus]|uniref:Mannosyl-oligosaccharide glucosidase n=1 Tax=Ramazzottius varieornatus TaxID=947166 RepID=A0A1D1VB80_RAMVA|nr:hypothetical protein RvY_08360 [Ramazzottius varieornatus]